MFQNVVIGYPIVDPKELIALDDRDWESEKENTLFTNCRFLPNVLKEAGIVKSTSEVRKNKPELVITLDKIDSFMLKYGKKRLYIIVGCETEQERDLFIDNINKKPDKKSSKIS